MGILPKTVRSLPDATMPVNSKGNQFPTIQGAIDDLAGDGFVFVPEGTYNESVSITNNNVILFGAGWESIIDGGTTGDAINVSGDNVIIEDLQVKTDVGQGNAFDGIDVSGDHCKIIRVFVNGSDCYGIDVNSAAFASIIDCYIYDTDDWGIYDALAGGDHLKVRGCFIDVCGDDGIYIDEPNCIISDNDIRNCDGYGIRINGGGDDSIVNGNLIDTTGDDGIHILATAENCEVVANRIMNWTNEPIDDDSDTSTVKHNDCGGDVYNSKGCGFGTVQDAIDHLNGNGWVEVPEGTWSEALTIGDNNVELFGCGRGSIIDGGITGTAITVTGDDCTIHDLEIKTTQGQGNPFFGVHANGGARCHVFNCYFTECDHWAVYFNGLYGVCRDCVIAQTDYSIGTSGAGDGSMFIGNTILWSGHAGININANSENCIIADNRIVSWGNTWASSPVLDASGTSVVKNNNAGGDVYNSKGCGFATVQAAIDDLNGDGWVEVPDGTWNEALTIDENDVILRGRGWASIINGGASGPAITASGNNIIIQDLRAQTTGGGHDAIYVSGTYCRVINVYVSQSNAHGIHFYGAWGMAIGCLVKSCTEHGIAVNFGGDNATIESNQIDTVGDDGIWINVNGENCVVVGNRITNWTNEGIDDDSGTSTVANNDTD